MKKFFEIIITSTLLLSPCVSGVSAEENSEMTRGPVCEESNYYKVSNTKRTVNITDEGTIYNSSGATVSRKVEYSRSIYADVSVSGSYSSSSALSIIAGEISFSAEISAGRSVTKTVSTTISVGPYRSVGYELGNYDIDTYGYIQHISSSCNVSESAASANYSSGDYSYTYDL